MSTRAVLVTGTSTGIGASTTKRLAGMGHRVYAGVRREEDGERLVGSIGGDVVPLILDVTNREHIDKALARIDADLGQLHGVVNNAGVGVGGMVEMTPDEDWRFQFDVNFFGLVTLTREAMPLVDNAGGRFVHIGSIAGRVGSAGLAPYVASKHAVEGFNWALRQELRNTAMTSSVVEPGEIATAIWDKGSDQLRDITAQIEAAGLEARYGFVRDAMRGFINEGAKRGIEPDKVARAVEHALTAKRPRARYLVGADAKMVGVLERLPDRARESLLRANAWRLQRAGRRLR